MGSSPVPTFLLWCRTGCQINRVPTQGTRRGPDLNPTHGCAPKPTLRVGFGPRSHHPGSGSLLVLEGSQSPVNGRSLATACCPQTWPPLTQLAAFLPDPCLYFSLTPLLFFPHLQSCFSFSSLSSLLSFLLSALHFHLPLSLLSTLHGVCDVPGAPFLPHPKFPLPRDLALSSLSVATVQLYVVTGCSQSLTQSPLLTVASPYLARTLIDRDQYNAREVETVK